MKTNHGRGYRANKPRRSGAPEVRSARLSDGSVATVTFGGDASCGHRGEARAKSGAKKRLRAKERLLAKKAARVDGGE